VQLPFTVQIGRQRLLARMLCRGDITALTLLPDGRLRIGRRDDSRDEAAVESGTTVYPGLAILRLCVNDRVETLVLPRAATGSDAHRRLRVWLKWRATVAA
jgi:hypothetical protein